MNLENLEIAFMPRLEMSFQRSVALVVALGACATLVQVGCAGEPPREVVGKSRTALSQSDCAEYGGSWSNGNCTLPGGTTVVDVPIDDDEPIEPWTGPGPDEDMCPVPGACGGGDPPGPGPDPEPDPPGPTHAQQVANAANRAACVLQRGSCSTLLSSVDYSAFQTFTDIRVRGGIHPNAPASGDTVAQTVDVGPTAEISLMPGFYELNWENQVLVLLHETGHATARINGDHTGNAPNDPTSNFAWNNAIAVACLTPAARDACNFGF